MSSPLKQRRDELRLSQAALAQKVGVDAMSVSRWERGEAIPRRKLWPRLEQVMGRPIGELLGLTAAGGAGCPS